MPQSFTDWAQLHYLVPEPDCKYKDGVILEWIDHRPQPTYEEINAVDVEMARAALEAEIEAKRPVSRSEFEALATVVDALSKRP